MNTDVKQMYKCKFDHQCKESETLKWAKYTTCLPWLFHSSFRPHCRKCYSRQPLYCISMYFVNNNLHVQNISYLILSEPAHFLRLHKYESEAKARVAKSSLCGSAIITVHNAGSWDSTRVELALFFDHSECAMNIVRPLCYKDLNNIELISVMLISTQPWT